MPKRDEMGARIVEYKRKTEDLVPITSDDAGSEVVRMSIRALQHTKRVIYENTEEGLQKFSEKVVEYFRYIDDANSEKEGTKQIIPDVEGLALYCGITRKTLFEYERNRRGDWSEYIRRVKEAITQCKKTRCYSFQIPQVFTIFDLKNNSAYVDAKSIEIEPVSNSPHEPMSPEEIQMIIESDKANRSLDDLRMDRETTMLHLQELEKQIAEKNGETMPSLVEIVDDGEI